MTSQRHGLAYAQLSQAHMSASFILPWASRPQLFTSNCSLDSAGFHISTILNLFLFPVAFTSAFSLAFISSGSNYAKVS